MKNIKSAQNISNPRKIGLWQKANTGKSGYSCSGSLWQGGPSIRFCFTATGELWLVQIQSYDKATESTISLHCEWALNDAGEVAWIDVEGGIGKLIIERTEVPENAGALGKGKNPIPNYEIYFDEVLPEAAINEALARKRRAGVIKKVPAKTATQPQTQTPNYKTEEGEEKKEPASVATPVVGEEGGDDIPF